MAVSIHPKVGATVVAGALTGLVLAELNRRGIPIQPDEAADLTVLVSAIAGYFMPADTDAAPPPAPYSVLPRSTLNPPMPPNSAVPTTEGLFSHTVPIVESTGITLSRPAAQVTQP